MRVARHSRIYRACILLLVASGVRAQVVTIPDIVSKVGDYKDVLEYYGEAPSLFSSHNTCLARGFSSSLCASVAAYCAINDLPLGGVAGGFIDMFQLTQLFKTDCGNGICFACCYVPGGRFPCHTSFFSEDGSPVINCDDGYGPGTHQVGPTLVTDPNAKPGQACLFTPQTCDHLPICSSGLSSEEIAAINADPQNIMKSPAAVSSRARSFGTAMLANWSNFLSDYHTSTDIQSDSIRQQVRPFSTLGSFLTGRGCVGWRNRIPDSFPSDWSEVQFRINDTGGMYAEEPSHLNGVRQLGLVRLMGTIPNLFNRLAFVESRIWTPDTINQYLAKIGDPDAAFLQHMSPIALAMLKENRTLQDYRLLAVPLAGETVSPRLYDGCVLGDPPALTLTYQKRNAFGIDLAVVAGDSTQSSALEVGLLVLWGDGSETRITVPPGGHSQTFSHDYAIAGKYQVLAVAQNDAGLRGVGAVVAETAGTGTNPSSSILPVISEIQLVDLRAEIDSFAGNTLSMMFQLESWPSADLGYVLGISRTLSVPLTTSVRFGTIGGWNNQAAPLPSITIRPFRFGDGFLIGFQKNYFTLDRLRIGVYSTQDSRQRYQDIPVTAEMIRLYPVGNRVPVLLDHPTYGSDGRLEIPVEAGGTRYERVDLLLPQSLFVNAVQGPVTDSTWTGIVGTFVELKPSDGDPASLRRRPIGSH